MKYRPRNYDESALLGQIMEEVENAVPVSSFKMKMHPERAAGHLLAIQGTTAQIDQAKFEQIELALRKRNVFNSFKGLRHSPKDNGFFIDLSGFTDSPVKEKGIMQVEESHGFSEMERYISIDKYNEFEEGHPGYTEMMDDVTAETFKIIENVSVGSIGEVLEVGAGTGNYTRRIGKSGRAAVTAVEPDGGCAKYLVHKINSGEIRNTALEVMGFVEAATARPAESFDVVNTTFADHHFSPDQKVDFLKHIVRLLKQGGAYILGDEFLSPHDESNPAQRVNAQVEYHGMVIEEAFKEGKIELPNLELAALISGLRTTVKFIQQTVPDDADYEFRVRIGAINQYNQLGIFALNSIINRLSDIPYDSLTNPENLESSSLSKQRHNFLNQLRELKEALIDSRCAGLQEDLSKGEVGGDYKMTIRQFVSYLKEAGLKAVGFFEGPKAVGRFNDVMSLGKDTNVTELLDGQNHAGGVWVIKAIIQKLESTYTKLDLC